jgi:hypothetical protein
VKADIVFSYANVFAASWERRGVRNTAIITGLARTIGFAAFVVSASGAQAETRVALVIGNGDYAHAPHLTNPTNDADAIAASLRKAGFTVDERKNVKSNELRGAILSFSEKAENADVAVVYYAGHGIQADGVNYLIPVDAALASQASLSLEAVPADSVLGAVALARHLRLLILDACRDNPFKAELAAMGTRGVASRGLAPIAAEGTSDTIVAYSAKDNTVALDGTGANSPFASALAHRLDEKGTELDKMFREVRDDVIAATNGQQTPFVYGSRGAVDFYFMPGGTVVNNNAAPAAPVTSAVDPKALELSFWNSASTSNDPAQLQDYLDSYPDGTFAALARAKIASLEKMASLEKPPEVAPAAPVPAPGPGNGHFDGVWNTIVSCESASGALGYSFEFPSTVKANTLHGERGLKNQAGWLQIDGKILPDGSANLYADGLIGAAQAAVGHVQAGTEYGYHVDTKFSDASGNGHRVEGRPCSVMFTKE